MAPPNLIQQIWGVFNPINGALIGVTTSGGTPYSPIPSAQVASSISGVNGVRSTPQSALTVWANSYATPGDGGGGQYVLNPADTTSGATFVGSCAGTALSVSLLTSGTLAVGQTVARGDTGATIGVITAGGGLSWTVSPGASVSGPVIFAADNGVNPLVGFDGGRWYLAGTMGAPAPTVTTFANAGPPILTGAQLGSLTNPTTLTGPMISYAKYFQGSGSGNYEGGCAHFMSYHVGGTQPSVGLTGSVQLQAGAAQVTGLHGHATNNGGIAGAAIWGGWSTAIDTNLSATSACNAHEMDITLYANRAHALTSPGPNDGNGLLIVNISGAVGANHGTRGLGIYSQSTSGTETSWFTAFQIGGSNQNAVVAGNTNEAIQLNGGTIAANAYAGFRTAGFLTVALDLAGKLTGNVTTYGIKQSQVFQSDVTTLGGGYTTSLGTAAAAFVLVNLRHHEANQGTFGAGSSVTNQVGFYAAANLSGATNNYGFYGALATGFNFYAPGVAPNFMAGYLNISGAAAGVTGGIVYGGTTQTTVGATGAASALPANPLGYIIMFNGSTKIAIPFYNG